MSSSPAPDARRISVIVPVKRLGAAKSRTQLPSAAREELALDLMARTISAALGATSVARVIVVAGDGTVATAAHSLGALVLLEPPGAGLNGAIVAGRQAAQRDHPEDDVVILVGDLAEPSSDDLDVVVAEFRRSGAALMVADHLGTGTTLLAHPVDTALPILFGADSARRHQVAGYRLFSGAPASVRHDVDSPEDVEALSAQGSACTAAASLTAP